MGRVAMSEAPSLLVAALGLWLFFRGIGRGGVVWVAAGGMAWAYGGDRGVFKTTDGGRTWRKLTNGLPDNEITGASDLVIDPSNPDILYAGMWDRLRSRLDVSSRANQKKTLRGSRSAGYASLPPMGASSASMITFSRDWKVTFAPDGVRIQITDSLSGGGGLDGMEDSIVYELTERVADDEFRGTYSEANKKGTLRMVRSQKREVVK